MPSFVSILRSAHCQAHRAQLQPQINLTSPALSISTPEGRHSVRPTPNPSKSSSCRASRTHSSVHYLRRLTWLGPSGLDWRAHFQTRTLIVSALVMSACSSANSFLPLSPNPPKSCQQINPWLPTTHSSLSQQQAQLRLPRAGYSLLMSHLPEIYIV